MQKFTAKIVNMMKAQRLYASQGGPIILSQVKNQHQQIKNKNINKIMLDHIQFSKLVILKMLV